MEDKKHQVFGSIIGLKEEYAERYKSLHRNTFPGVLERIRVSNITDYSIFLTNGILFSHMVYEGNDYAADMAAMGRDAVTRDWWLLTDPMQQPVEGSKQGEWWAGIEMMLDFRCGKSRPDELQRMAFMTADEIVIPAEQELIESFSQAGGVVPITMRVFSGFGRRFIYLEVSQYSVLNPGDYTSPLSFLIKGAVPMETVFHTSIHHPASIIPKKVFVTGCFDMLHSGHVAFLQEAAGYGDVYVCIGSDANVADLKSRHPVNSEQERKYMLEALSCVTACMVNTGWGIMDFLTELDTIRPDIFIVNEDGHTPGKEALCRERGIEYRILKRIPHEGLPARSTTRLITECMIPFRIDLAGGWLDQPYVSVHHPGAVLTVSIEPTIEFNDRSGMASSTRKKAIELWRTAIPHGDPEHLARVLFSYENPPGTKVIAGSQDSLGIVLAGLNRLDYAGTYWPERITSIDDEDTLRWIEEHLFLVTLGPRVGHFNVLANTDIGREKAGELASAADDCWNAILSHDLSAFGNAFRRSFEAQVAMFPNMAGPEIFDAIAQYRDRVMGWKLSGAGGGGYLILVSDKKIENAIRIRIRRKNNL